MSFQIGAYKNLTDGRTVKINSKTIHPQYNETEFLNDIVLYQLEANVSVHYTVIYFHFFLLFCFSAFVFLLNYIFTFSLTNSITHSLTHTHSHVTVRCRFHFHFLCFYALVFLLNHSLTHSLTCQRSKNHIRWIYLIISSWIVIVMVRRMD